MALRDMDVEVVEPVIQPAAMDHRLGEQHGRQVGHIEEGVFQRVAQFVLQRATEHALIKGRVKGEDDAARGELHETEQRFGRWQAVGQLAWGDPVDQHAFSDLDLTAEGAFELLGIVDGAVFDDHCADGDDQVALEVQPGGFQIQHHQTLLPQRDRLWRQRARQLGNTLLLLGRQLRTAGVEPEHTHS